MKRSAKGYTPSKILKLNYLSDYHQAREASVDATWNSEFQDGISILGAVRDKLETPRYQKICKSFAKSPTPVVI